MAKFLDTLHTEHETVKSIFEQIAEAEGSAERGRLFNQLKRELLPHMRGEEKYFYPALKEKEDFKEDALEAVEEHHAAKLILNEIDEMSPDTENWVAKVTVLQEMIEHHIEEEEDAIFTDARSGLTRERLDEIGKLFESEKSRV